MDFEEKVFWGLSKVLFGKNVSKITVCGEKKDEKYLRYSQEKIAEIFIPDGKVFSPKELNSYCTFQVEENTNRKNDYSSGYIAIPSTVRPIKPYNLIIIPRLKSKSLSIEELDRIIDHYKIKLFDGIYYFHIGDSKELIGPFLSNQNSLLPKIGKEVPVYNISHLSNLIIEKQDNNFIFFNSPDSVFDFKEEIDCMSTHQLKEWFKQKIKEASEITPEEESAVKIMLRMLKDKVFQNANDLDTVRFERIFEILDQFDFSYDQLKDVLKKDDLKVLSQKIENMRSEIKEECLKNIISEIKSLNKEKLYIQNEKEGILSDIEKLKSEKTDIENDVKCLSENYDSLLQQLKLNAKIGFYETKTNIIGTKPCKFEIKKEGKSFSEIISEEENKNDIALLYHVIGKNLNRMDYNESIIKLIKSEDNSILKSQAVFIPCISWAYIYAQGIGNAEVYSMHIEHDWLHYRDFCNNGLLDIWNEAWEENDKNIVLVLENINITQPECGINPLLDVINGYRPVLEGTDKGLPDNLKIFTTRLPSNEDSIGLKLSRQLFNNWGTFGDPNDLKYRPTVEIKQVNLFGYFEPDDLKKVYKNSFSENTGVYFDVK